MCDGRNGESYNVGGRAERTNLSVVETICDVLDRKVPRKNGGSRRDRRALRRYPGLALAPEVPALPQKRGTSVGRR